MKFNWLPSVYRIKSPSIVTVLIAHAYWHLLHFDVPQVLKFFRSNQPHFLSDEVPSLFTICMYLGNSCLTEARHLDVLSQGLCHH